ncbi:hypothetical protein H7F36_07165 [Variovorax sp. PAMC28562]|uniref:hypothetical protein n=1 Tax=Variovorax sp. PAMC28562 TaxID=2762323 RepID=UPI00164E88E3|nr:hypothetical protein [Variovorax sp. PAMC28562]QNK74985.1 hypothetical protein H7F36_07165 [Variovorax sp. PAMC28562]
MPVDPLQVLRAAQRPMPTVLSAAPLGTLLIAGATGALGNELVRRLAGSHRYAHTRVLAREPMRDGLRGVETVLVPTTTGALESSSKALPIAEWPRVSADTAIVAFDPPRLYHDRERALWLPDPAQLPDLARWLRAGGVTTLVIVQPHTQGGMPEALKRGLASLDEQAVVALGFDRVILLRSAQKPTALKHANTGEKLAAWMLSITRLMVPSSEQPVRASKVAELVDVALVLAPPGVHIAAPELVWRASQGDLRGVARSWLGA